MSTLHENDEYEIPTNCNNSNFFDMSNYDLNPVIVTYVTISHHDIWEYLKMDENESSKLMSLLKEWNLSFLYQTCVGWY